METINNFFEKIKGKNIGFLGLGISHEDTALLFKKQGANVFIFEKKQKNLINSQNIKRLESNGIKIFFEGEEKFLKNCEIIFRTPSLDYYSEKIKTLKNEGKIITSEIEVFLKLCPCKIICITGSDGKTSTSTIIYNILKTQGYKVHLGGNIGIPILKDIFEIKKEDIVVLELSSFQLSSINYGVDIAVLTNVTQNHLDYHKTMKNYINAKKNLTLHQDAFSKTIINYKDKYKKSFLKTIRGKLIYSNANEYILNSSYLSKDGYLYYNDNNGNKTCIIHKKDILLKGHHNALNYLSAISAVWGLCDKDAIVKVAKSFKGVKHRLEHVLEIDGVNYYNDSIASTPIRTISGLKCFNKKLILIAGGYDKNLNYSILGPYFKKYVKILIVLGQNAKKIIEVAEKQNINSEIIKIFHVNNMNEAIKTAKSNAKKEDIVLLSPASASFDMYKNFEERGLDFIKNLNNI